MDCLALPPGVGTKSRSWRRDGEKEPQIPVVTAAAVVVGVMAARLDLESQVCRPPVGQPCDRGPVSSIQSVVWTCDVYCELVSHTEFLLNSGAVLVAKQIEEQNFSLIVNHIKKNDHKLTLE